jgi:hypothetical protein
LASGGLRLRRWGEVTLMNDRTLDAVPPVHGGSHLPSVEVDSYNVEIRDDEGSNAAFRDVIDHLRKLLRRQGEDLCVPKLRFCNSGDAVRRAAHAM